MAVERIGLADFLAVIVRESCPWSVVGSQPQSALVVDIEQPLDTGRAPERAQLPACPVIGFVPDPALTPEFVDVIARNEAELSALLTAIGAQPHAATVLVQLLRQSLALTPHDALFAESLAYSTLQHGQGFMSWLGDRPKKSVQQNSEPALLLARSADCLKLRFNRAERRNAYSAELRDALCEALSLALVDDSITRVSLRGNGPAFCAGGDLAEFGEARDATVAHLSRLSLSAGALLLQMPEKIHSYLHGACIGAGIELPAFGGHITAAPDSFFQLPEVAMGLVPGAGGTVSLPRRIGAQRSAWMALTGERISAEQALAWGLVDELTNESFDSSATSD